MGILVKEQINDLIKFSGMINNHNEENLKGASYDLRCGNMYYCPENDSVVNPKMAAQNFHTIKKDEYLYIPPYQFVFIKILETIYLPNNITARLGLRNSLLFKGVLMASQTQIDPGYRGPIFCMLHNISDTIVQLKYGDHVLTVEFNTTDGNKFTTSYSGDYNESKELQDVLKSHNIGSGLTKIYRTANDALEKVKKLRRDINIGYTALITIFTLLFTLISIFVGKTMDNINSEQLDRKINIVKFEIDQAIKENNGANKQDIDKIMLELNKINRRLDGMNPKKSGANP